MKPGNLTLPRRLQWLSLALFGTMVFAGAEPHLIPAGYRVETLATPLDDSGRPVQFGVGGIDFAADGTAYIAGRVAGVWTLRGDKWSCFADGLHDPQGILVSADGRTVIVSQKPELTELRDTDGDGVADVFRTLCDKWGYAGNYCEYVHGVVRDHAGNIFLTLNLADGGGSNNTPNVRKAGGVYMGTTGGYDGWAIKVSPDGAMEPIASGLRSPAGIGISRDDEVFFTDNQGGWVPASTLHILKKGAFYGYPASLLDHPDFGTDESIRLEVFAPLRQPPVVWIPYGELANSPGNPEFDYTEGKFGPFSGQIFIGDQTRSNIFRVSLDKVDGEYQGCVFNFVDRLQCGNIRIRFDQQGRLWSGQTGRGWAAAGGKDYGLERVVWDGKTTPFEIHSVNLTPEGFQMSFTKPLDRASLADAFAVEHWHYYYHGKYGSPKVGTTSEPVTVTRISDDGREVWLKTVLVTGEVYDIKTNGIRSTTGESMSNVHAWYTLNRLCR